MSLRERIRRWLGRGGGAAEDPMASVRWVDGEGPWAGVRILDTRAVATSMLSLTQDAQIAESFARSRSSAGNEYRGKLPADARAVDCRLQYAFEGDVPEGPLFKAREMEDKWDIYAYDGLLQFVRSWTGLLTYSAQITFEPPNATITQLSASLEHTQSDYCVRAVDFLIRSHVFRWVVPYPLPRTISSDPRELASFAINQYGRWSLFGTFEDTVALQPVGLLGPEAA